MALDAAKNTLHGWYKSTVEYVTPINEKSEFKEKGVLTPEEFLTAGCQLVYKCPTWQWESGDPKKQWPFLPKKQQYLISRNLPCWQRVASLKHSAAANKEEIVENGEWLNLDDADKNGNGPDGLCPEIADIDLDAVNNAHGDNGSANGGDDGANDAEPTTKPLIEIKENYAEPAEPADDDDFEVVPDIEDFDDEDNVVGARDNGQDAAAEEKKEVFSVREEKGRILKTRTYDVSITYDKYYRVPRVWLRGYDENGTPLTSSEIFEDISADHAHKTVTVEPHVHTGVVCASIHPCRHSEVMRRFMATQKGPSHCQQYLFLFLKFMSAVIPTIHYDFTQAVVPTHCEDGDK